MEVTNALALDYVDPALEGQTITFSCASGQTLNGSNQSICMGNGKWDPDPRDVECTGEWLIMLIILCAHACMCLYDIMYMCDDLDLVIHNIKSNNVQDLIYQQHLLSLATIQSYCQQSVCLKKLVLDQRVVSKILIIILALWYVITVTINPYRHASK